jgi:hypothetical protein
MGSTMLNSTTIIPAKLSFLPLPSTNGTRTVPPILQSYDSYGTSTISPSITITHGQNDPNIQKIAPPSLPTPGQIGANLPSAVALEGPEVVEPIQVHYQGDYNIGYLDQLIRRKLALEHHTVTKLKFRVTELQSAQKTAANIVMYKIHQQNIDSLLATIKAIETGARQEQYTMDSQNLLEWYKARHSNLKLINLHQNNKQDDPEYYERLLVIENYLELARKYITLEVVRVCESQTNHCHGCGTNLTKVIPNMDGEVICPRLQCATVHNMKTDVKMPEVGDHVANYNSGKDESIENFHKAQLRFQARQAVNIPAEVYQQLEDYFHRTKRPSCMEIRQLPLNSRGWRGDTSVSMLRKALDDIKCSKLGKHTWLIGKVLWHWQPLDISAYIEIMDADYNETQVVFHTIPVEVRVRISSPGTEYRLWRALQMRGCPVYFDMFMIADGESWEQHEFIWRLMCEGANNPEIKFVLHKNPLTSLDSLR